MKLPVICVNRDLKSLIKVRAPNESKTITMSDDEVDQDLLEFMRVHMNGSNLPAVEATTGVLESAEYICDVRTLNLLLDPEC